ncbi:hypothetical protein H5410_027915, partial [Solanum commersonii]
PRSILEARNACAYTLIADPYAQLLERLRTAGVLQTVEGKLPDPMPQLDRVFKHERSNQMHSHTSQCEQQPIAKP